MQTHARHTGKSALFEHGAPLGSFGTKGEGAPRHAGPGGKGRGAHAVAPINPPLCR
jgi:hypothetical protein